MLRNLLAIEEKRGAAKALSPVKCRRIETRELMAGQKAEDSDRLHIHSVLELCGLPYRLPGNGAREHVREHGKNSLAVVAGYPKDPVTGNTTPPAAPRQPALSHFVERALRAIRLKHQGRLRFRQSFAEDPAAKVLVGHRSLE